MTQEQWGQVWVAYQSACELPPAEREAFVHSSLTHPELREKALELLAEFDLPAEVTGEAPAASEAAPEWTLLGRSIGRFEVLAPIGRGGMGEVYRAHDPELGRDVAIKCIAPRRLGAPASVSGMIREARSASGLNHPGIVTIHEVIRTDDTVAIVMELVEGECLRKFTDRPQPATRVASVGRQVAQALAATHDRGIVHRDIKPENLILRPDGYVKILDFGLASAPGASSMTALMGTARYMPPEQGRGGQIGPAADVFALGVVLYELATGVHPFAAPGRDTTITIARSIAAGNAARPSELVRGLPARLESLILSMLAKDPGQRPPAAEVVSRLAALERPSSRRLQIAGIAAAAILALGAFARLSGWVGGSAIKAPGPLEIVPFTTYEGAAIHPSFSPDGSRLTFSWSGADGTNADIYWRNLGDETLHRVTTDPAEDLNPVFSPDGRSIAFFRQFPSGNSPQVVIVPVDGGPERLVAQVADLSGYRGIAWWPDGKSLLVRDVPGIAGALVRLYLDGHKSTFTFPTDTESDGVPVFSPDTTRIAFLRYHPGGAEACWMPATGGPVRCVAQAKSLQGVAWHPSGRALYYADANALWRVELRGVQGASPVKLSDGSFRDLATDAAGKHLAFGRAFADSNIYRVARDGGTATRLIASSGEDSDPAWSPDGKHIVIRSNRTGNYELYVYNPDGTGERQITHFAAHVGSARWSPDGRWIAFDGNRAPIDPSIHYHNIFVVPAGGGDFQCITDDHHNYVIPNWSPDSRWIYYGQIGNPPETRRIPFAGGPSEHIGGDLTDLMESSDGRYFYYTTGAPGIFRRPVGGGEAERLPGTEGIHLYRYWQLVNDGIYFVDGPPKITLRFLDLRTGRVRSIASLPFALVRGPRGLAASPDGSVILCSLQDVSSSNINLIKGL